MKVYVFCHKASVAPSGGTMILFRVAEALIRAGYDAYVLIPGKNLYPYENPPDYKPHWFETNVQVIDDVDVVTSDDVVIIHEEAVWAYNILKKNNPRHIMINQGIQASLYNSISYNETKEIYKQALGTYTISDYISKCVNRFFDVDKNHIHRINTLHIMDQTFAPGEKENKIIIFQKHSSKGNLSNLMLHKLIVERYNDWRVVLIDGQLSLSEVAYEMSTAKIMCFLCNDWGEGIPLPVIEGALSGCKIIGYSGVSGREFFVPPLCTEVEYNDVYGFIRELDNWTDYLKGTDILTISLLAREQHSKLSPLVDKNLFDHQVVDPFKKMIEQ